jgi:hypothetical protein
VTVRVTWVVWVSVPEVAVMVTGTLFDGVPPPLVKPTAHPPSRVPVASSSDKDAEAA